MQSEKIQKIQGENPNVLNKSVDVGALLIEDCRSFENIDDKEKAKKTQENLCQIYKVLFDVCKQQKLDAGGEDEILEYTRSKYTIELPEPNVVLPREKPVPKPKPLTKWEKFR